MNELMQLVAIHLGGSIVVEYLPHVFGGCLRIHVKVPDAIESAKGVETKTLNIERLLTKFEIQGSKLQIIDLESQYMAEQLKRHFSL